MSRAQNETMWVNAARFEELVVEALESIPQALWDAIENLAVVVEDWPSAREMRTIGMGRGNLLLGLYEGVPLTERHNTYGLVPPDKITIFRGPILRVCAGGDEDTIREQVRHTVLHEVAHHFGISDAQLMEWGVY
jgi:predicted Zn-dependent protease with MMP-like domain